MTFKRELLKHVLNSKTLTLKYFFRYTSRKQTRLEYRFHSFNYETCIRVNQFGYPPYITEIHVSHIPECISHNILTCFCLMLF